MAARSEVTDGTVTDRAGWRLELSADASILSDVIRDKLIGLSVASAAGENGAPNRRSRYAATYQIRLGGASPEAFDAFVKVYDPPRSSDRLKRLLGGSRASRAARAAALLAASGINAPRILLCGEEPATGRTMLVAERAEGVSLAAFLAEPPRSPAGQKGRVLQKREVLRALGAEVAALHRAGFIHGDLTPHNVFVTDSTPIRFTFIDHDRTRRAFAPGRRRRQLRNLVQLLRFDLPRLTAADRMRVFHAWSAGLELQRRDRVMHRGFKMLKLRIARDSRIKSAGSPARAVANPGAPIAKLAGSGAPIRRHNPAD
jgi:serine/threonine protein kinase